MSLRQIALNDHRHVFFLSLSALIAPFALRPESSIYPIIGILSILLIYTPILFRVDTSFRKTKIILLVGLLSIGSSVFRYQASLHALSTSGTSIAALLSVSTTLSTLGIAAICISTKLSTRLSSPWSRVTLFPAVWTSLWCTVAYISPVGHLATWSAANNVDAYNWLAPYLGPVGKDWIVAAWAVVISETITQWYMEENEGEYRPLLSNATSDQSIRSNKTATQKLALFLVVFLIPHSISSDFPIPLSDIDVVTPLSIGCVLPTFQKYQKHALGLDDFIKESNTIRSMARVILWPEGAVTFNSAEERKNAFQQVRAKIQGVYVGVSFEETIADPDDPTGRHSISRTGLAVISQYSNETQHIYYKRHLVPVAESYRLKHSTLLPTLFEAEIHRPKSIPPSKWGPAPDHTRPILMTSSICLDFAMPSPFDALQAKPSLILAPARTWDPTVGNAMWLQARQRAAELGSTILWCDGGEGGVSGVAGGGFNDVTQVGSGSFVRTIGIPYPFKSRPTFYARFGGLNLILIWMLVIGNPRKGIESAIIRLYGRKKKNNAQPGPVASQNIDLLA